LQAYKAGLEFEVHALINVTKSELRLPTEDELKKIGVMRSALVAAMTVLAELNQNDGFCDKSVVGIKPVRNVDKAEAGRPVRTSQAPSESKALVGFVEIAWRGKVERTFFALPLEIDYLVEESKEHFLENVGTCLGH
jgi:hypothetical protein